MVWLTLIASAAIIFHIVAGYPLFLTLHRREGRGPVARDDSFRPTVSVIVAVHNGASMIRAKIATLQALDYPANLVEILIVSDGSTDETESILRDYADQGIHLIAAPRAGKAAALNLGLAAATGEIVFLTDVRQPLEPSSLRCLVSNFADPSVGAVTGELVLLRGEQGEQMDMDLYWRYEIHARTRQSEIDSLFNTTGCIYAIRRSLMSPLPPDTLTDDAILPLRAFFAGYRVVFDPRAIAYDYPAVAGTEFRRRFRTLAGLWQVHLRMPQLFTGRNRMRFHFLSHKFGRLMLPWAILVFLLSTVALPQSMTRTLLLLCEAAWFALAGINAFVPGGSRLKRFTSPASTLLVMNAAAAAAIVVFFVPATRLWTPTKVSSGGVSSGGVSSGSVTRHP